MRKRKESSKQDGSDISQQILESRIPGYQIHIPYTYVCVDFSWWYSVEARCEHWDVLTLKLWMLIKMGETTLWSSISLIVLIKTELK